jgi:cytochrome P450
VFSPRPRYESCLSLRVRPVILTIARQLQATVELGRYTLPAGVAVRPCAALLHSDPVLYPQPECYRPERFLEPQSSATSRCARSGAAVNVPATGTSR